MYSVDDNVNLHIFKYVSITVGLLVCVYLVVTELTANHNIFKLTAIVVVTLLTYALANGVGLENTNELYYIFLLYVAQACVCVGYDVVFGKPSHDEQSDTKKTNDYRSCCLLSLLFFWLSLQRKGSMSKTHHL